MQLFVYELISAGGLGPNRPPSLRAEGWAMLEALVHDFDGTGLVYTITLLDTACAKPLGRFCRRIDSGETQAFKELVADADMVLVIAPEFNNLLAERSQIVLDAGKMLLGSNQSAIDLAGDKWTLARHLAEHGVRTPETTLLLPLGVAGVEGTPEPPAFAMQLSHGQSAVLKPRHGAGSQATYRINDTAEFDDCWLQARHKMPGADFILSPFIPGHAVSVTFMVGPLQQLALQPAAQHLSTDGRFQYLGGELPLPPASAERAITLARQAINSVAGLAGLVGVDLILGSAADGSQDWVIEINPRPTTSYIGLRQLAEDNLAKALLAVMRGDEVRPICWRKTTVQFSAAGDITSPKG